MVNNQPIVLSKYQNGSPPCNGESRDIGSVPLYDPSEVKKLLVTRSLQVMTQKCSHDISNLDMDDDDVCDLLSEALNYGRFLKSVWCEASEKASTKKTWAACDSYVTRRRSWCENAHKEMVSDIYVKFAIGRTGVVLLIVSCHLSN